MTAQIGDRVEVIYVKPGETQSKTYRGELTDLPIYSTGPHARIRLDDNSYRQFSFLRHLSITPLSIDTPPAL